MPSPAGADTGAPVAGVPGSSVGPLSGTLRRGAAIATGMLVFTQLVSLVQTLVLARLLAPAEVGWFAAGTVLSGFLTTFAEAGMSNALVQREGRIADVATTVFWATLLAGVGWAAVALASAPLIAWIFSSDIVGAIAAVSAGTIVLHALTYVPDALMQRRFDFRERLIVRPVVALTFAGTSIILCINGFGVWGLVIGTYCSTVAWLVTAWTLAGWRPGADGGKPSFALWRELARFSLPLVVWTVVNRARDLLETAVVGGALSATALGYYRYGRRLGSLPETAVIDAGSYVLFPAFSRLAGDPERFRSAFLRALGLLWGLMVPVAGFVIAAGEPGVTVLLGEKWRGAGVMLVALAGIGPGVALMAVGMESIKGTGRTHLLNWVTLFTSVLGICLLFALLPLGLTGVGLALSLSSVVAGVLSLLLARPLAGVTFGELTSRLGPPVLVAAPAAIALGLLEHLVSHSDQRGFLAGVAVLLGEGVGYLMLYAAGLALFAPAAWRELSAVVRQVRHAG
ncbi:lipopolysaccharide biosynthesis protein [Mycolicibacterium fluoranthenivorans]|uniref:PST family polysaccharide transporter n=1 Tax=Mycolicibacterium fluoranthenivorans TaxID=258505 RepID=A0A7X5U3Y0_9MYCO|nr:lipopolysaccharide biosynthesis protein [Mycolicibacterium fluoranthenivorans]MCV7356205.1 lipopolysaccharide biosynthesis protein [Mycolicibacterium fluoranthenivorans]NIH97877.1 PST family polysaccharide transporter [Mycolicibacterium fluoranthenivorans]